MGNLFADGNLAVAEAMSNEYGLIIGHRESPLMHPAIAGGYLGRLNATGADTASKSLAGLGLGDAQPLSENADSSATALSFAKVQASVGRQNFSRRFSDMLKILDPTGLIKDPTAFAFDAATIYARRVLRMIASAGATFTGEAAGTGAALTWEKMAIGTDTLIARGVTGPVVAVLKPKQWADLRKQSTIGTNQGDAMQAQPDTALALQLMRAVGYQGNFYGIDIFTADVIPTANAGVDYRGCMFAAGGIVWADAVFEPDPDATEFLLDGGALRIAAKRDEGRLLKTLYYDFFAGVAVGQDNAGVKITSIV